MAKSVLCDYFISSTRNVHKGTCTFGFIIGNVNKLMGKEDQSSFLIKEKITALQAYMKYRCACTDTIQDTRHVQHEHERTRTYTRSHTYRGLPTELKDKIRTHYEYRYYACINARVHVLVTGHSYRVMTRVQKTTPVSLHLRTSNAAVDVTGSPATKAGVGRRCTTKRKSWESYQCL